MRAHKLLIVDPSTSGETLAEACSDFGLTVLLARTAETAIDHIIADRPDAIIVEVELPDAPGIDLAEILRGDSKVPLFLASAKRDPDNDIAVLAAMDLVAGFIHKPYAPEDVVQRIASALNSSLTQFQQATAAQLNTHGHRWGEEDLASGDTLLLTDEIDVVVESEVELADAATRAVVSDASVETDVLSAPSALDLVAVWEQKVSLYQKPHRDEWEGFAETEGRLEQRSVDYLFDVFYRGRRSGELALSHERCKRLIVFDQGHPVYARSNVVTERFGTHVLALRLATTSELRSAMSQAGANDQKIGEALVGAGVISDTTRRQILARVVWNILLGSFAWQTGQFKIGVVERARFAPVHMHLRTGHVVLRGLMQHADNQVVANAVALDTRFAPVSDPPYPLEQLKLRDNEARILVAADGSKTVADLAALFALDELNIQRFVFALCKLNVLELVGAGPAIPRAISFF